MAIPDPINRISDPLSGIVFNEVPIPIFASTSLSIEVNLTVSTPRITTLGTASLSIESGLSISTLRIVPLSQSLSIDTSINAVGTIVQFAQANLDGIANITIVTPIVKTRIDPTTLSINSSVLIADLIRFTPSSRYPGSLVPLLVLDNHALTDQGRKFSDSIKQVFVEKSNWNNSKSRYYKRDNAGKQTFKISWEWLPSTRESTVDKREARDYIKKLAMDPDIHTLKVVTYGADPEDIFAETAYNVFITSYSEDLVRRDLSSNVYFWKCDLELEEV